MAGYNGQSKLLQGAANPAAPKGLQQTERRLATQQQQYDSGASKLQPWMPQQSMLETAKSWYGGANAEGTENGWDTAFYKNAFSQYDQYQKKAADSGKGSAFYDWLDPEKNRQATGVATWGADPMDEAAKASGAQRFGDVYNNGKKVANLYDDYDKATADVMAGEFMFSGDDKKRMFADPNRQGLYADAIEKGRVENTNRQLYAKSAESYQDHVATREKELREGYGNEAIIGTGAALGAAQGAGLGFAIGSFVPVIGNVAGAVIGGVIGGIAGGVGAGLNQDQLVEMAARADEKADIANQTLGASWVQKTTMKAGEYSQLGQKLTGVTSNIWQGAEDARLGTVGDMTSEFYAVDKEGNRKVSVAERGVDIAATVADSLMQWGSPTGRWIQMGTMGVAMAGNVAEISTGSVFNDKRGQYDKLDTWQEWASSIGSTAIDAVQIGVGGAFAKAARSSRAAFTGTKALSTEGITSTGAFAAAEHEAGPVTRLVDKGWAKLRGTEVGEGVNLNGVRFMTDESGQVLSSRITLEMLAPSEFMRWIPAGWRARRLALKDGGAMTRDHLMQASMSLTGQGAIRDAAILGYSEGMEELAQAWLDPQRTGDSATLSDMAEAYLYGAAGGAGMALGPANHKASNRQQLEAQAHFQHQLRTGEQMSPAAWKNFTKGWTTKDFENGAKTTPAENQQTQQMLDSIAKQQRQDTSRHSSIGLAWAEQSKMDRFEKGQRKALEEGNGSLVLMGQTSEFLVAPNGAIEKNKYAANAGVMSARETIHQLDLISKGHQAQLDSAREAARNVELARDKAEVGSNEHDRLSDQLQELLQRVPELTEQIKVSGQVSHVLLQAYRDFINERDPDRLSGHIERMNTLLVNAYTGKWTDPKGQLLDPATQARVQRSVELKLGRHPLIDKGSFALLLPQISERLTQLGAHSTVYLQQGMLKAMNADHDGDTGVPQHAVYMDDASLARLRKGDQYMKPTQDPKTGKRSVELVIANPDGEWAFLDSFAEAMMDSTSRSAQTVVSRLSILTNAIKREFSKTTGGPLQATPLDGLLTTFVDSVKAGRVDARMNLVTDMVNLDYEAFRNHQNADNVPSVQWLWSKINETWDILQKDLAHARSTESVAVQMTPQHEASETKARNTIARQNANTASGTLALLPASDPVRGAQALHYSALFRSLTQIPQGANGTWTTEQQIELTELFMRLGSEQTQTDLELITGRNAIEERVYAWLGQMANSISDSVVTPPEVMLLLANMAVPSVQQSVAVPNTYEVVTGDVTLLQLLLRRSVDIYAAKNPAAPADSDEAKKIKKLRRLTYSDAKGHSYTASLAMVEVMGNRQLHELIGSGSSYISPNVTLNQLIQQQRGLHPDARNAENHRFVRSPAYIKDADRAPKDPPWRFNVLTDIDPDDGPPINAFAMLVDAVKVAGDTYVPMLRSRDETVQKNFILGLSELHQMMQATRVKYGAELSSGSTQIDRIKALRTMLATDQDLALEISKLIPEAAGLGVFEIHEDNSVTQSKWLEQMLTLGDTPAELERAAAMYYFHTKMAEFIVRSGTVDMNLLDRLEEEDFDAEKLTELGDVRGRIDPTSLRSRFQQIVFHLASQKNNIELFRFLKTMNEAPSIGKMFELLNNEPVWRNNQAELLPWHDDVSDFEVDPSETWESQMTGALQRENIRGWGTRMQIKGSVAVETMVNHEANKNLMNAMGQYIKTQGTPEELNKDDARMYVQLLEKAIKSPFPDNQGQVARTQLTTLQMMGVAAMQNKGKADELAAPYGEPLITLDSFGYSDGLRQELAAVTAEDVEDVRTNLTMLRDGPVRLMFEDGSHAIFDITDVEKAHAMLADPRTQDLAIAVLFPSVRDVNTSNVVQTYQDTDSKGSIAKMLLEQNHAHLFNDYDNFGEKLQQAHRYIGMLDGYVRKQAVGNKDQAVLDKAFMPIQQMVHDFIAAYLHSKDVPRHQFEHTADQLYIDIADAIKAVASVDPRNRGRLRETIAATLADRFVEDSSPLERLLGEGTARESFFELQAQARQSKIEAEVLADFDARIEAATTEAEKEAIDAEFDAWAASAAAAQGVKIGYPARKYLDAVTVLNMYTLTGDQASDDPVKADILSFLGKNNRINTFWKKGNQPLYNKMLRLYDTNPTSPFLLNDEEWSVLGGWAAEAYLNDTTTRASSAVPNTAAFKGEEGAVLQRYYDQSWSYLVDTLFDEKVLEGANTLAPAATYTQRTSSKDAAKLITNRLLSEKRLGTWTPLVVSDSMKARMVLKNASVGAAVAQEGNDPKVMADYVGGGRVTWERPQASHFSVADLPGAADQGLFSLLDNPLAQVKLEHHFVTSVIIQSQDPNNQLDPVIADALSSVTSVNATSEETEKAGQIKTLNGQTPSQAGALRVLDLSALDAQIEWLKANHQLGAYTVHIEYVDVNKKPFERAWANNIFFDGTGREAVGGSSMGAVASLFFGLEGLSKVGQQNPLDQATKEGMNFRAHKRTSLNDVENLEQAGGTVAEILAAKAAHMMQQDYPTGKLLNADLPTMYKLMKMRHVIVGMDDEGQRAVWWPEQIIQYEEAGMPIPLTNWKLHYLGDREAQTLWGRSGEVGTHGTPGSLTRPTFNIQDLDIFPDLSKKRLRSLGLEGLGETRAIANSRLAQVTAQPRAMATEAKGHEYVSLYAKRLEQWQGQMQQVNTRRADKRSEGKGKLDVGNINEIGSQLVINMLDAETQSVTNRALGVPDQGLTDLSGLYASRMLAANLSKQLEAANSMIWVYKHGAGGDLTKGWLGRADIKGNMAGLDGMGAVYGDVVIMDLTDIENATDVKDSRGALKMATDVIKDLAQRGVTISVQASRGQYDLQSAVVENLTSGGLGYRRSAESNHFFVPITEDADHNAAQRAYASTLLETPQNTTRNVALRVVADGVSTNLTEATEQVDFEHDPAALAVSHVVLPYRMMSTGSVGRRNAFSYNEPARGLGQADQMSRMAAQMLELLDDPAGVDYLKDLLNEQHDKDENPRNPTYPLHRVNPNGTVELGILPLDDALAQLKKQLETGTWPLDKGETFYAGTIVPLVSGNGAIHLSRVGFKQPNHLQLMRQSQKTFMGRVLPITAASRKLDPMQRLPPPTEVDEVVQDVKGISVRGTMQPSKAAKGISEGIGLKSGYAPMSKSWHFPDAEIKAIGAAGARVTRIMGSTSVVGKQAMAGLVNNFRDAFAVTGINFEDDMIDFFFGGSVTSRSDQERAELLDLTIDILQQWSKQPHQYTAEELSRILDNSSAMAVMEAKFNAIGKSVAPDTWRGVTLRQLGGTPQDPTARLGTIMLAALAAPGVQVDHVLSTQGITTVKDHDNGALVRLMPALMTDALNDPAHPELRKMLINRLNRNMPTQNGRLLYWFDNQLKWHSRMEQDIPAPAGFSAKQKPTPAGQLANPWAPAAPAAPAGPPPKLPDGVFQRADGTFYREEEIVGHLQVHIPLPADENAVRLAFAGIASGGTESKHVADTIGATIGGRLTTKAGNKRNQEVPDALDEFYGDNEIERFENEDRAGAAFYYMLNRLRTDAPTYSPWMNRVPMEHIHVEKASDKVKQYLYVGERNEDTGWSDSEIIEGDRLAMSFLAELKITDREATKEVAYLARQLFGIPGPATGQTDYIEHLSFKTFQTAITYMEVNLKNGKHPLEGGTVPLEHEAFWKRVFDAQKNRSKDDQWLPLMRGNKVKEYAQADNWADWVNALMGQMRSSHEQFDSRFGLDLDGFYHTFQGTHPDYMEMALSIDDQRAAKLMDPDTNREFVSVDPGEDAYLKDPIVLASQYFTYNAIMGHGAVIARPDAPDASASVVAQRIASVEAWQKKQDLPKQKDLSVREYAKQGAAYQANKKQTSNAMRNMVNASIMMRLFNPALYVSAMFEVPFRSAIEGATNVITGQLTGRTGKAVAGAAAWLEQGLNKGADQWWLTKQVGLNGIHVTPRYTVDDINKLDALNKSLGENNKFLGMVYGELAYQNVITDGQGRVGGALETGAATVAKWTADPKWGMKADTLAKRYNDAVWEYLSMSGAIITVEQYAYLMQLDPAWVEKNDPVAHKMGLNAVKQSRGAKATMLGNAIMSPLDKWTESKNGLVNGAAHLLKIPFLFTRFNANMLIALTGLHGLDQAAAMFFDGRQKPQIIKRLTNRGKQGTEEENTPEYWDNEDVIESIDLSRAFVRGAVTQTGLMAMAMLAHGFSLGGEDEEERRRKRMAAYLNTPYYYDPNKASNDFRWTDAIFLDNVPILSNIFMNETGHAAVMPHWIFRQFLSPVLGMMRFFETGDVTQIQHGFLDAASVMPNSVARLWDEANETTKLLMESAGDDTLIPEKQDKIRQVFMNMVFVYEKALVENTFINGLYTAFDQYDRNPWAVQEITSTGDIVREQGTQEPVATTALQAYQQGEGDEGSSRVGPMTRHGMDAILHQYSENNATAAVIASIIPWVQGHDSSYLRGNMVTKKERVQVDETPETDVKSLVYAAYLGDGGQDFLTKEEIIGAIKQREQAAGRFWDQGKVEAEADAVYATVKDKPLSVFDGTGKETMTLDGKKGVFRSLRDGVIGLDSPAIKGFNISQAERDQIGEEMFDDLVQEGVDVGLSDQSAMYRARRLWYGDKSQGTPGLKWILYDKRIPDKPYVEYDRLNVTYVLGPDGKPWATPFQKANVMQILGLPIPHQMAPTIPGVTSLDERGNTVDLIRGINTGQAALVPRPVATEVEANDKAVDKAAAKTYTPGKKSYTPYKRYGYRRHGYGGGGGGGGYSSSPYFQKMMALPMGTSARIDDVQAINTSNPIIRRADVRRERITSERGRLKQWQ